MVGLSGFLTLAFDSMKETIEAIEAAGLRGKVKIMIGGGQIDETVRSYTRRGRFRHQCRRCGQSVQGLDGGAA